MTTDRHDELRRQVSPDLRDAFRAATNRQWSFAESIGILAMADAWSEREREDRNKRAVAWWREATGRSVPAYSVPREKCPTGPHFGERILP